MAEMDCPATKVTGPGRRLPPCPPHRPELRAATASRDFRGSTRPRWRAGHRACEPASVAAARRRLLTSSSGAVRGAPSRGGQSHPPARAPCRPPRSPFAGAPRGGVTAPPAGIARRWRAAAAAVVEAAPLSPPDAPPTTATWLYVPPPTLVAMEPAGVPGIDASPSALPHWRPGYCTHVPGIPPLDLMITGGRSQFRVTPTSRIDVAAWANPAARLYCEFLDFVARIEWGRASVSLWSDLLISHSYLIHINPVLASRQIRVGP